MTTTEGALDVADRLELHEIPALYGDLIDARDWPGLAAVFTDDAVFEITVKGTLVLRGLDAIRAHMDSTDAHPLAHLMVNIRVAGGDPVRLHSRVLGILPGRLVGSGSYVDEVVRTPAGWRIRHRRFTMLRVPRA
ncbi:nuclear transport factor 2 family protein [Pseudonocardia sp. NPDC049154]|uniref:nuclear transport factor 2 family protein n=1 Tax=Pseudonocardia sp. NPDC049154 TaxID=3155501 RepID=UPI0033DBB7A2